MSILPPIPSIPPLSDWRSWVLNKIQPPGQMVISSGPWRPRQWSLSYGQMYMVTASLPVEGGKPGEVQKSSYFFDAVLRAEHEQALEITKQPVQSGVPVADHAFLWPARLVLNVGFSDAMDRFTQDSYNSFTSKSISAFDTFQKIQANRVPCTVTTRLKTYTNMVLTNITAIEDNKTRTGLRATLTFEQIIPAQISTMFADVPEISQRAHQSQSTNEGNKVPGEPSITDQELFKVPDQTSPFTMQLQIPSVLGAGNWSSASIDISPTGSTAPQMNTFRVKHERPNYSARRTA